MIDAWFKKDLEKKYKKHRIVVFIDESKNAEFLLEIVKENYKVYVANNEIEELKVKYEIEKSTQLEKTLIYTNTPKDNLKFIREYCATNDSIEIGRFDNYIKQIVHKKLKLNLLLQEDELISAAKVSIGKDENYWRDLSSKGSSSIFNLEKDLLPFLHNPNIYIAEYDKKQEELFYKKVNELIEQTYVKKPAATLAKEVVVFLLDGLANNKPNKILFEVYKSWVDSREYQSSFKNYLSNYKLKKKEDIFDIHPSHPFKEIDEKWLIKLGENINNKDFVINFLAKINQRINDRVANSLDINFWKYVKVLLDFDDNKINQLVSFQDCVNFYIKHFYKLDNSIRNLYALFLNDKTVITPIQDYYKNKVVIFLDKWFNNIDAYTSTQTGKIQEVIDNNTQKTAIVVGDGVSYEFAQDIIDNVSIDYVLDNKAEYILAGLPSETEHNMSQLYVDSGEVLGTKSEREKYLTKNNTDKNIGFVDLDKVNELTDKDYYLICSHKDPDKLGETYQLKALNYFNNVAKLYASKIEQLFKNGYENVYLLTDHGFVLTGVLENSDKISVDFKGKVHKTERYIRTTDVQSVDDNLLIKRGINYEDYKYCYFAKRISPFKTPGVYGFSHGGFSPQETIIPFLKWSSNKQMESLNIIISNKKELSDITGELYAVKLQAKGASDNLFTSERKIILMFFAGSQKLNESDIITIKPDEKLQKEYQFGEYTEVELKVLDAVTKEQLDKVTIKKNSARDLGGL